MFDKLYEYLLLVLLGFGFLIMVVGPVRWVVERYFNLGMFVQPYVVIGLGSFVAIPIAAVVLSLIRTIIQGNDQQAE